MKYFEISDIIIKIKIKLRNIIFIKHFIINDILYHKNRL